jgi:hypothetical protein
MEGDNRPYNLKHIFRQTGALVAGTQLEVREGLWVLALGVRSLRQLCREAPCGLALHPLRPSEMMCGLGLIRRWKATTDPTTSNTGTQLEVREGLWVLALGVRSLRQLCRWAS